MKCPYCNEELEKFDSKYTCNQFNQLPIVPHIYSTYGLLNSEYLDLYINGIWNTFMTENHDILNILDKHVVKDLSIFNNKSIPELEHLIDKLKVFS